MLNVMYFTEERPHRKQMNNKLVIHIYIFIYIWKHTTLVLFFCAGFFDGGGKPKHFVENHRRHKNCWGILCEKSRFYAKKSYFFQF
jgi:hypothetical protein